MSDFQKSIVYDGQLMTFKFSEVVSANEKYFVQVIQSGLRLASFEMQLNDHKHWKILHPAPKWIMDMEHDLVDMMPIN